MTKNKFKTLLWFIYDLIFSSLITSSLAIVVLIQLQTFSWYWLCLCIVTILIFGYYLISFSKDKNRVIKSLKVDLDTMDSRMDLNLTYIPLFGFIASFSVMNHLLFLYDTNFFAVDSELTWTFDPDIDMLFYAYDNFFRAACLDLFETYNFQVSRISGSNVWIITLTFIYKTFLSIFFIKTGLSIFNALKTIKTLTNNN